MPSVFQISDKEFVSTSLRAGNFYGKNGNLKAAYAMLLDGNSIRKVSRTLSMSTNTVAKLNNQIGGLKCKCGTLLKDHHGWCSFRYAESERRQKFVNNWAARKLQLNEWAKTFFAKLVYDYPTIDLLKESLDTEEKCLAYFIQIRWNGTTVCPGCGGTKIYAINNKSNPLAAYKCAKCRKQFTPTVGTILENRRLPLQKYFIAIHRAMKQKEKINSIQLSRELSVTQKTSGWTINKLLWIILDKSPRLAWIQKGSSHGGKPKEVSIKVQKVMPTIFNFENAIYWLEEKIFEQCQKFIYDYQNAKMLQSEVYESAWMQRQAFKGNSYNEFEKWIIPIIHLEFQKLKKEELNASRYQKCSITHKFDDGDEVLIVHNSISEDDLEYKQGQNYTRKGNDKHTGLAHNPYSTIQKSAEHEYIRKENYFNKVLIDFVESNYSASKVEEITHAYLHLCNSEFEFTALKKIYEEIIYDKIGIENFKFYKNEFETKDDWITV